MTTWAAASDVERAAREWTQGQIACRTYGHTWAPVTVTHRPGVYTVTQRCGRCRNTRWQEVDERGYPMSGWHITYQNGYLLSHMGRVGTDGRAVLRLNTILTQRITEEVVDE